MICSGALKWGVPREMLGRDLLIRQRAMAILEVGAVNRH